MFDHFIVTQFNVKFLWSRGELSSGNKRPSKEWMTDRWRLFELYCYKSIMNQSNKNFRWIVFFDDKITDKKKVSEFEMVIPIYLKNYETWTVDHIKESILNISKNDYIITTRLDNDDCLGVDYIDEVQNRFSNQDLEILNFVDGQIYHRLDRVLYRYRYMCTNPFLSVIEKKSNDLKTCFYVNHPEMREVLGNTTTVETYKPAWLQVIHGKNLGNKTPRGYKTKNVDMGINFGITIK